MKKYLVLIMALLFTTSISNAQTEKGNQTLGVDAGFTYSKDNSLNINPYDKSSSTMNSKTTSFNIGPNYSYFIANNVDIGASLSYSSDITNSSGGTGYPIELLQKSYGGSVYLSKYFMCNDKIGFRAGPFISYQKRDQRNIYTAPYSNADYTNKTDYWNAGINLAFVYYPSKKLGVSAMIANLNCEHSKTDNGNQGNGSGNGVNFNFVNDGLWLSLFILLEINSL